MSGHEQQHGKKGDNRFFPLKKGLGKIRVLRDNNIESNPAK
jgi:hypothetical protein